MPIALGALIFEAVGVTEIAGFAIAPSTFAIVGNIPLIHGAVDLRAALPVAAPRQTTEEEK